jgi:hypothetical protein
MSKEVGGQHSVDGGDEKEEQKAVEHREHRCAEGLDEHLPPNTLVSRESPVQVFSDKERGAGIP